MLEINIHKLKLKIQYLLQLQKNEILKCKSNKPCIELVGCKPHEADLRNTGWK